MNGSTQYRICDRCKKEFPNTSENKTAAFFNSFLEQDGPWLIDLCPECKKELYRWMFGDDKESVEQESAKKTYLFMRTIKEV